MAETEKQDEATDVISQIGKRLASSEVCPNKSTLVKLLKQAKNAFLGLKQSGSLKNSVKPLSNSLIRLGLLDHKDRDVRLLVGICLCEVIRVLAPNPGFSPAVSRDIFRFLLGIFEELDNIASPFFSERASLLGTVAKLRFYLVLLDIGCEDVVLKMFKCFFSVVRENHPQSLITSILSIITSVLEEEVDTYAVPLERTTFQSLLDVVLQNIVKGRKDPASFQLAISVLQNCGENVQRCICQLLESCIFDRDAVQSAIKESYHEILLEIHQNIPQLSISIIPHLVHELQTDQVDVRIKALNLIRNLLALHGQNFSREYPNVFIEILNRFTDKSVEVRLTALSCAKALYITNPSQTESLETAIKERLLDHDDKVRMEAVNVVCELAKTNLKDSSDLIAQAAERLRDKKILVRNRTLKKLVELYQEYCTRGSEGIALFNEHIEEIPCKVLMLCYEKNCQEYRPQSMELVLEELFPASISMKERTRRWILIFSRFKPPHLKALKTILSQKQRLRAGLKDYLDLCSRMEDYGSEETERKLEALVVRMSSCFPDPAKAKECFQKLKGFRDKGAFGVLQQFLSKGVKVDSDTTKDVYLKELGKQEALSEFFHILFRKCAFNIFGSENVQYILDFLSSNDAEEKNLKNFQVELLLTIIGAFPSLLRGKEKQFQLLLLEEEIPFNEQLIEVLAREGYHMPIKLSDVYSSLEKVCLEGTRAQSKLAVSAISALADISEEQFIFSKLCKVLVDCLRDGQNAPTVLQSLGCMAQYSVSAFESQEKTITNRIVEEIFQQNNALASVDLYNVHETSNCCSSCKLKVFGLKALVRSFLPHKNAYISRPISFLLHIVQQMLQNHFFAGSIPCKHDEAFIRLAAAKSVLRLSRKWDLHISPTMFRLTILMAKDNSPMVRRSFTSKIHKLLKNHAIPSRYACTFLFVALDSLEDLRTDALKYLEEFIRENGRLQINEAPTMEGIANHPVYLVVFLIHILAHDPTFPALDCRDEEIYADFLSPLFVAVQSLVNEYPVETNFQLKSFASLYLRSIFNAIKKAEDAVVAQMTPKLHLLAEVGISILDSLNTKIVSLPHTPALVPLPSSLYKSGSSEMGETSLYPLVGSKADASFSKKLVSSLKAQASKIGGTGSKHGQQLSEIFLQPSGTRHIESKSKSTDKLLMNRTKEQIAELHTGKAEQFNTSTCKVDARGQQNLVTPQDLGSVILDNKLSAENKHMTGSSENLGAKTQLLCDSTTEPSLPQNKAILVSREEETTNECDFFSAEPSRIPRAYDQLNHCTSKCKQNIKSNGTELVGKHIKKWSPIEKCYYAGVIDSFDSIKKTHQVTYKTGEIDNLSLDSETWEFDLDDLQERECDHHRDSSAEVEAKTLDACSHDTKQENKLKRRDTSTRKASQTVKRSKRLDDTIAISTSEVTDTNRRITRSRRQKV